MNIEDRIGGIMGGKEPFGPFIRRQRQAKGIGLRELAKMIGVSPTYLSKVERDEFAPPAEDRVKSIAEVLDLDPDELLARAGKVASDLTEIIKRRPREAASFLRTRGARLSADEWIELAKTQKSKNR